jgi:hypothetical protein
LINGGTIYYTNTGVSDIIESIQDDSLRNAIYEKINGLAIQPAIDEGIPFELTLSGVEKEDVTKIEDAIIFLKDGDKEKALDLVKNQKGDFPAMFKEVEELLEAGYDFQLDIEKSIYTFSK